MIYGKGVFPIADFHNGYTNVYKLFQCISDKMMYIIHTVFNNIRSREWTHDKKAYKANWRGNGASRAAEKLPGR